MSNVKKSGFQIAYCDDTEILAELKSIREKTAQLEEKIEQLMKSTVEKNSEA